VSGVLAGSLVQRARSMAGSAQQRICPKSEKDFAGSRGGSCCRAEPFA
jgi:hypothetical protein